MRLPKEKTDELISAIQELKSKIKFCNFCFNPFEPDNGNENNLCPICKNSLRNRQNLCVVEKETDLISIENTKKYNGLYFILGGNVNTMRKSDMELLRVKELQERIISSDKFGLPKINFSEIIVATNPTVEGKATSILIERALKEIPQSPALKITHLAKGLPVGGELEYADEETLESAFEGRK
jgi:recombination protein RecR